MSGGAQDRTSTGLSSLSQVTVGSWRDLARILITKTFPSSRCTMWGLSVNSGASATASFDKRNF